MNSKVNVDVDELLQKVTRKPPVVLEKGDFDALTTLFVPYNESESPIHSKAYLALSALRENAFTDESSDSAKSDAFLRPFLPAIDQRISDVEEKSLLEVLSFIAALFTVDRQAASSVFTRDGFQESMMDALDLFETSSAILQLVAQVLSLACGHKACISLLSPRCLSWLESSFRETKDEKLKSLVALALLKLSRVPQDEASGSAITSNAIEPSRTQTDLFTVMRGVLIGVVDLKGMSDTIEGLAYFSTIPTFKEKISKDTQLVKKLVSFHSQFRSKSSMIELGIPGTIPYGLCTIVANLCAYKPKLSDEEAQIARLKKFAQPKSGDGFKPQDMDDLLNDDDHARERGRRLVDLGITDLLVSITKATDSPSILMTVGKAFLSLVENKDNRGKILQCGGAKSLMTVIRSSHSKQTKKDTQSEAEYSDLPSIQALAKLAITSSPLQVFGPSETAAIDAITPFTCLLLHPSSNLLQKFESLMALTNLSSTSPELATRIADTKALLAKVEFLLLDDNILVRRAAAELVCNLVSGSEAVFNAFSGESDDDSNSTMNRAKSKLHILVALSDVEDEPTRLAASGALAVLTSSPTVCNLLVILEFESHKVFPVFKQLIEPDEDSDEPVKRNSGLVHRGVVCLRNTLVNSIVDEASRKKLGETAQQSQVIHALTNIFKGASSGKWPDAVLQPAAEALKWMMESGVKVL